jgi:hypothetical protein
MRRVEIVWLFIIAALTVSACDSRPVPRVLKPEDVGARQLTQVDGLGSQEGAAVQAAIARLAAEGSDAAEYYLAPIERRTDSQLELALWYKAAFESPPYPGNPGGKSRTMVYDVDRNAIIEDLLWQ